MKEPFISVILPVLNAADVIEKALLSVLRQRYPHREIVIVDGGSTDGTLEILERHQGEIGVLTSKPDRGIYDAMNKGIDLASGDWLYFLGADDLLVDVLHRVAPRLRDEHTVYYGDVYKTELNRIYYGDVFPWHSFRGKNICHQAIFYPRAVFEHYRYSLDYPICADHALNIQLCADRKFRFRYLRELICIFGVGVSALSRDAAFERDRERLFAEAFAGKIKRRNFYLSLRGWAGAWLPASLRGFLRRPTTP